MLADVQFDLRDPVVLCTVTGDVDLSNAARICDAIGEATPNTALGVVLDMSHVDYLDSAGIHLIYRLRENLRVRGQKLMLVIPADSSVQDSLRLAGVAQYLPIAASVDEALASFVPAAASAEDSDRDAPQGEPAV